MPTAWRTLFAVQRPDDNAFRPSLRLTSIVHGRRPRHLPKPVAPPRDPRRQRAEALRRQDGAGVVEPSTGGHRGADLGHAQRHARDEENRDDPSPRHACGTGIPQSEVHGAGEGRQEAKHGEGDAERGPQSGAYSQRASRVVVRQEGKIPYENSRLNSGL